MTVAELIANLQSLPNQSLRVVVRGYEDGFNDIASLKERRLVLNAHSEWYYGKHAQAAPDEAYDVIAIELCA